MISVRTLDLVDPLYRREEGGSRNTIIPILPRTRRLPLLFCAAGIRTGCRPVLRLYYNLSRQSSYKRTRVFDYAKLSETMVRDLREYFRGKIVAGAYLARGEREKLEKFVKSKMFKILLECKIIRFDMLFP